MANVNVKINPEFEKTVVRTVDARLAKIARDLRDEIKKELSDPYPPASVPGGSPHKRTGGLRASVFSEKVSHGDYAIGYRRVKADPKRPNSDRQLLGIWMELGTGNFRQPFPKGSSTLLGPFAPGTSETGSGGAMEARPVLVPVLLKNKSVIIENLTRGGGMRMK